MAVLTVQTVNSLLGDGNTMMDERYLSLSLSEQPKTRQTVPLAQ
jgi:hypothetical protein